MVEHQGIGVVGRLGVAGRMSGVSAQSIGCSGSGRAGAGYEQSSAEGLARALRDGEFRMHYQPQLDCRSGRVIGAEALMRWNSSALGRWVSPVDFIPLAERDGFIVELGDWSMAHVMRTLRLWQDAGRLPAGFKMAINLSARQLTPALPERIACLLGEAGIAPPLIELEITESHFSPDMAGMADIAHQLRRLGLRLAIDDFGTGYSILAHLRHIPANTVKIDRGLTRKVLSVERDHIIMRSLIGMIRDLGMQSVCEGVETAEELAALRQMGADSWQGFLSSPAVPAEDFIGFFGVCAAEASHDLTV
ncbi:EAL domain-containing protein [Chromobacterium piscinae]|uniref:EAL domain-containing protein n=1 Tax=Chromobacterium piscinae TaxID=686831 RepID=UPI00140D71D0|nr:EAL domain-containing protein [Chromobacterium piscinae]MBX9295497.1 EAL domain-containing protein [Chromobacterium vaccinii]MBX9346839.1 EAL domain-containing protein [Chromobacterium vaccinii]MBX9355805.1 EAL domain-containing protein [Chromobacterium vaccinii]MCD4505121.1 EAL domain-containing protein [Chromobacterium piscinae]MCD5328724.1 EAL domain-containing protein [Chromobacterium piscinae]